MNILLLTSSISSVTAQPVTHHSGTVAKAHIMAWLTMLQRNVSLHMPHLPEQIRKGLLDSPISPDGLFETLLQNAVTHLQQVSQQPDKMKTRTPTPSLGAP